MCIGIYWCLLTFVYCLGKVLGLFVVQFGRWAPLEHDDIWGLWLRWWLRLVEVVHVVLLLWFCACGYGYGCGCGSVIVVVVVVLRLWLWLWLWFTS